MVDYPSLTNISVRELIAAAGGDPWALDATLRAGDPGQIAELARAFRDTAACTTETWNEFSAAAERFHRSWNRENGEYPINDSAELQRVALSLRIQKQELPQIAITLQNIAADLAEAQRMSDLDIARLNSMLWDLDSQIGAALARDADAEVSAYEDKAIDSTRSAKDSIRDLRAGYEGKLHQAETTLRLDHGYDPGAIEDVDGDAELGPGQRGRSAEEFYDNNQRARDEALVNTPGEMTPEKAAAAARLRDFGLVNDPTADSEARRLAGERLDDFRMANFVGPLPVDPLTGTTAAARARNRLDMQAQLEQGQIRLPDGQILPITPMTPDRATDFMDVAERDARVELVLTARKYLLDLGVSGQGAMDAINGLLQPVGLSGTGADAYARTVSSGAHALPSMLSPSDAKILSRIATPVGLAPSVYQFGVAASDLLFGDGTKEDFGRAAGSSVGGAVAGWGGALAAASFLGPVGTITVAVGAAIVVGGIGDWEGLGGLGGAWVGRQFDNP